MNNSATPGNVNLEDKGAMLCKSLSLSLLTWKMGLWGYSGTCAAVDSFTYTRTSSLEQNVTFLLIECLTVQLC